jgi:hypothetical protein
MQLQNGRRPFSFESIGLRLLLGSCQMAGMRRRFQFFPQSFGITGEVTRRRMRRRANLVRMRHRVM